MTNKCKHFRVDGICTYYSDVEVTQPCIEGPCEHDTTGASELKNCPFCGGKAEHKMWLWGEDKEKKAIWLHYIFCLSCDAMTDNMYRTEAEAITAWNTRTAAPRFTAAEREAMNITMGLAALYAADHKGDNAKECHKAIATVRKMLEEDK